MINKRYTEEDIEKIVEREVIFRRYDAYEDVMVNAYCVPQYKQWGFPWFESSSKKEVQDKFRSFLKQQYANRNN